MTKEYPTPRGPLAVLSDVSLSLNPGDAAAIMGPSGSGKSTLLYILGVLEPPTAGTITLDDRNPFTLDARAKAEFRNRQVGFVFQDHCLLPQCTVLENVLIPTWSPTRMTTRWGGPGRSSSRSGLPIAPITGPRRCQAASGSAPLSRAR